MIENFEKRERKVLKIHGENTRCLSYREVPPLFKEVLKHVKQPKNVSHRTDKTDFCFTQGHKKLPSWKVCFLMEALQEFGTEVLNVAFL